MPISSFMEISFLLPLLYRLHVEAFQSWLLSFYMYKKRCVFVLNCCYPRNALQTYVEQSTTQVVGVHSFCSCAVHILESRWSRNSKVIGWATVLLGGEQFDRRSISSYSCPTFIIYPTCLLYVSCLVVCHFLYI